MKNLIEKYQDFVDRAINITSIRINHKLILKDLYITEILRIIDYEFKNHNIDYILCGGTCLSKCYKKIDRLSEDIDLLIISNSKTQSKIITKDISNIIQNIFGNLIINKSSHWGEDLNYLNCEIEIKDLTFSLDITSAYDKDQIHKKELLDIFDIDEKLLKEELIVERFKVNCLDIKSIVNEKALAFHRTINKKAIDKINIRRTYRHMVDIYILFNCYSLKKDIFNNHQKYKEFKNKEFGDDYCIQNNLLFIKDDNYLKEVKKLLKDEYYGKEIKAENVILFFQNFYNN